MPPKHNVKIAALIVMTSIFLSRVLGFFREMLIASTFGRSMETDAFYAAFTIPDMMFYLLIGGTLSAAFIPVFTSFLAKDKEEEGWRVASNFINFIMIFLLAFTVLGMIFTPQIVPLVAYKFSGARMELAIKLTRIMFTAVAFTSLAGLQVGILNSYRKFMVSALGPIIYNAGIIISILTVGKTYGIVGVAYGVVFSAFANFLSQFTGLFSKFKFYRFIVDAKQEELHKIIKLAIPTILGLSVSQLNLVITQNLASGLDVGSITAMRYANVIMQLPVGIFAVGIATALFPTLTMQIAVDDKESFKESFSLGLRTILYITIPASIGLAVLREPIIRLLFANGEFQGHDVFITAYTLLFFTFGIAFAGAAQLLTRGFYSIMDTVTPVIIGFITVVLDIILSIIFIRVFKIQTGGLALASSIDSILYFLILSYVFNRKVKGIHVKRILTSFFKTSVAGFGMGYTLYYLSNFVIKFDITSKLHQMVEVLILIIAGVAVFGIISVLLKMEEVQYLIGLIKNKLRLSGNNKI